MQTTSHKIKGYLRQNGYTVGMITWGVQKAIAFLEETLDSYGITVGEWNTATTASI